MLLSRSLGGGDMEGSLIGPRRGDHDRNLDKKALPPRPSGCWQWLDLITIASRVGSDGTTGMLSDALGVPDEMNIPNPSFRRCGAE